MEFLNVGMPVLIEYDDKGNEMFDDLLLDSGWIMEPKCYGRRVQCFFDGDSIFFANKNGKANDFNIRAKKAVAELKGLGKITFLLDGALVSPSGPNDNMRLLSMGKGFDQKKVEEICEKFQEENGHLEFHVWDIMFLNDKELLEDPYTLRRSKIENLLQGLKKVKIVNTFQRNKEHHWFDIINDSLNQGCVLKLDESPYLQGSNKYWLKRKKFSKYKVIITEVIQGTGKYEEVCMSLKIGVWKDKKINEVGHVGGFSNAYKEEFWNRRGEIIGEVIEIEAQEYRNSNFILPRFKQIIEGRGYEECTEPIE